MTYVNMLISSTSLSSAGEPDRPILSLPEIKVESNNFSIPLQQVDDGGTPVQHFNIRYRKVADTHSQSLCTYFLEFPLFLHCHPSIISHTLFMLPQEKEGAEWTEMHLSPKTVSLVLQNLSFGTDYQVEVSAVNANGSSIPATFNFTVGEQPGMCLPHTPGPPLYALSVWIKNCLPQWRCLPYFRWHRLNSLLSLSNQSKAQPDQRHRGWHRHIHLPGGIPGCRCNLLLQKSLWPAHVHCCENLWAESPMPEQAWECRGNHKWVRRYWKETFCVSLIHHHDISTSWSLQRTEGYIHPKWQFATGRGPDQRQWAPPRCHFW